MDGAQPLHDWLARFTEKLPDLLKTLAQRGAMVYGGEMTGKFDTGHQVSPPSHRPRQAQLAISSGRLAQSFLQTPSKSAGDRFLNIRTEGARVSVEFGSNVPYANIQNTGGAIAATPKMAGFFMAMFIETGGGSARGKTLGDPFWLAMFIHAKEGHPITIRATGYAAAAERAAKKSLPEIFRTTTEEVLRGVIDGR